MSPGFLPVTCTPVHTPLTPSNSGQRSPPTSYRGCWHVVSRGFLHGYRHHLPHRQSFTTRRHSSLTRRRCVRVAPIAQDSPLLPPVGVWAVLSPSVADHPLRSATDRCLGKHLPYQLANQTQAHPSPINLSLLKQVLRETIGY